MPATATQTASGSAATPALMAGSACGKDCATCPRRLECPFSPDALKRMTGGGR